MDQKERLIYLISYLMEENAQGQGIEVKPLLPLDEKQLTNTEVSDPEKLAGLLMAGFMAAEETVLKLLASVIDVTVPELEAMPMEAPLEIAAALAEHQDLRAFFARAGELMKRLPEMRTRSRAASTT